MISSHYSGEYNVVISKVDVVVIGSGAVGAATAYYLTHYEKLGIALVDKHEIGSQTSARAAGMVSCARKSDPMISLIKDACRKIEAFTRETGQPLDWVHSGSLKIARRVEVPRPSQPRATTLPVQNASDARKDRLHGAP